MTSTTVIINTKRIMAIHPAAAASKNKKRRNPALNCTMMLSSKCKCGNLFNLLHTVIYHSVEILMISNSWSSTWWPWPVLVMHLCLIATRRYSSSHSRGVTMHSLKPPLPPMMIKLSRNSGHHHRDGKLLFLLLFLFRSPWQLGNKITNVKDESIGFGTYPPPPKSPIVCTASIKLENAHDKLRIQVDALGQFPLTHS